MHGTKADTLRVLEALPAKPFVVAPFVTFTVQRWREDSESIIARLTANSTLSDIVAVRSSAACEDVDPRLPPGTFTSVLDTKRADADALSEAIERVASSYGRHPLTKGADDRNEVIVQRQLCSVRLAGVMSTRAPGDLYFAVHYDDGSGRTDTVTRGQPCKRALVLRQAPTLPSRWELLRTALVAIESEFGGPMIVEFGMSMADDLHVFQVRRKRSVDAPEESPRHEACTLPDPLTEAVHSLKQRPGPWSDMADWNPAELLGDRPRALAVSLYQHLVTDKAWLWGRASLGYRDLPTRKLVDLIAGKPYVHVKRSFLSLTPAGLPDELAERYVNNRLGVLRENPELHDKVELELLATVADPAMKPRTSSLIDSGFSETEVQTLEAELRKLTSGLLSRWRGIATQDGRIIDELCHWKLTGTARGAVRSGTLRERLAFIRTLLYSCRDKGVVAFARQARLAFVARDLLQRLMIGGALDVSWVALWWTSLETVADRVSRALHQLGVGELPRREFDATYGHLRPRTYDIRCPRYADLGLQSSGGKLNPPASPQDAPELPASQRRAVEVALSRIGYDGSSQDFFEFARHSFWAREELKFAFSRLLSEALEEIAAIGTDLGLTREQLSFLRLSDIERSIGAERSMNLVAAGLSGAASERRAEWSAAQEIQLPDLIFDEQDLFVVQNRIARPNFVTSLAVTAEIHVLDEPVPQPGLQLDGKLVVVESADPGLDWIFSYRIAGLITRFGGALSHMAVRCAEFKIPAAIGCGDQLYRRLARARVARLDCHEAIVEVVDPAALGSSFSYYQARGG